MVIKKKMDYISFADGVEGEIQSSSIIDGMWKMKVGMAPEIIQELKETGAVKEEEVKEGESTIWLSIPKHLTVKAGHLMSNPLYWAFCDFRGNFVSEMPMADEITHHSLIESQRREIEQFKLKDMEQSDKLSMAMGDQARLIKTEMAVGEPIRADTRRSMYSGFPFITKRKKK